MELSHLNQINYGELRLEKLDWLIVAAGSQPRCYYLAEQLHAQVPGKILLINNGNDDLKKNADKFLPVFTAFGFRNYPASTSDTKAIESLLKEIGNTRSRQLNIAIDYSCMPKRWYAMFIDSLTRNTYLAERINLYLSYTPKAFEKDPGKHAIDYMGPIVFNRDNLRDKKPVSMIAALDANHHSLQQIVNMVKPKKLLAFIPQCTHDPEYSTMVMEKNKSLLDKLDSNSIIKYQADNPEEINSLLTSYCLDERISSEVLIVPQGPKTFSMMSMMVSIRYPDVKLWEIILCDHKPDPDHGKPAAAPVIVKASFVNDEDLIDE